MSMTKRECYVAYFVAARTLRFCLRRADVARANSNWGGVIDLMRQCADLLAKKNSLRVAFKAAKR